MSTFKIGEIAILIQDPKTTEEKNLKYDGEECIIIGPLAWYEVNPLPNDPRTVILGYAVEVIDGRQLIVEPHELRKKPQEPDAKEPQAKNREIDKVVPWDQCAWRPNETVVKELERQLAEKAKRDDLESKVAA